MSLRNSSSPASAAQSPKNPLRWFTRLFLIFLVLSMPVLVLLALLIWLLYYFLSGKQPKRSISAIIAKIDQMIEPRILLMACLLVAASLFVTTEVDYRTYAGFPFHYVTFYDYPGTVTPTDFWSRFAPKWNVDGSLFTNVFLYYVFIIILRQILWRQRT